MTPESIIKDLVLKSQEFTDQVANGDMLTIHRDVLVKRLQELIDRRSTPISNEKIAKMSNLLEEAAQKATQARQELEYLYTRNI